MARASILADHGADPVTFVKWWPEVSIESSGLAASLAPRGGKSADERAKDFMMQLVADKLAATKPTHVLRVQYRAPNESGENTLRHVLEFTTASGVAFAWSASIDGPFPATLFEEWIVRAFK